ncbi:tyrosine--tRNA ligase [Halobacteriovorax marinus]|uniref:Tyrosine--tRNA ligase n=1 Tax=Halobacteriovorax marinus (strain ATCC BAA-682 / DSM 15412 / SJ) TaxID=862908 RepID=E1WYY2_HALMS|nr:tyrosine--tRNA ligase [Halobacteriovorax marinus]ATH07455.1 tyrosine--tRNA ligase [Halobacteriovorax marinus]CBW26079.1 putative tyrosyl-tRNA synthetase [Halobacteriovorax marinus SJ]
MKFFDELKARGIIDALSNEEELEKKFNEGGMSFYCGYDPTARSLQLGNLFTIITCMRFQKAGHKPYMLVGGATGMIGDPSGKSEERNLLDMETLKENIDAIRKQLGLFVDFECGDNAAVLVNNADWWQGLGFLEFLRTIGKRFRVNEMLNKDSVKSRIESDSGISLTEFSYQVLQAYDFVTLNKLHNVSLQIGGSDQWGNMTAGTDLTRKMNQNQVYCMTMPLVTDQNGKKFGKSAGNAVFLDGSMTSPYKMYQFLLNQDDAIIDALLKYYTFLSLDEIAELDSKTKNEPHLRLAQKSLAQEVTKLVHGQEGLDAALRATQFFFGEKIENVSDADVASIFEDTPSVELSSEMLNEGGVIDMLSETPLFKSKKEVRRAIDQKGIYINNVAIEGPTQTLSKADLASETALVLRKGKKNYCVVKFK